MRPAGVVVGEAVPVGAEPYDIESGDGFLWTTNLSDGTISKIDPATGTSQQIQVGGVPTELVVDQGGVWVWNYSDSISRVDVATGQVGEPIFSAAPDISGIAAGGGYLWLSHTSTNAVTRINMTTQAVEGGPITVGAAPVAMAFGNRLLYVVNSGDRTISTIDLTGTVVGAPLVLDDELGGIDVHDGVIYVGTTDDVTPIDERSFVIGEPIPLKGGSLFAPDGDAVWVAFPLQNELRRFDRNGVDDRGGPVEGVGKGLGDLVVVDDELWLSNSAENTVVRVRVNR